MEAQTVAIILHHVANILHVENCIGAEWLCTFAAFSLKSFLVRHGLTCVGNYGAPGGFWYDPWSQDDPIMVILPTVPGMSSVQCD